jgi:hypothetical protein
MQELEGWVAGAKLIPLVAAAKLMAVAAKGRAQ